VLIRTRGHRRWPVPVISLAGATDDWLEGAPPAYYSISKRFSKSSPVMTLRASRSFEVRRALAKHALEAVTATCNCCAARLGLPRAGHAARLTRTRPPHRRLQRVSLGTGDPVRCASPAAARPVIQRM
jgi:hypothetical protein